MQPLQPLRHNASDHLDEEDKDDLEVDNEDDLEVDSKEDNNLFVSSLLLDGASSLDAMAFARNILKPHINEVLRCFSRVLCMPVSKNSQSKFDMTMCDQFKKISEHLEKLRPKIPKASLT